jgi:FdhD protein
VFIHRPSLPIIAKNVIFQMASSINDAPTSFHETGGIHAAFLYNNMGQLLTVREDVGRHNAMDKLIGQALMSDAIPLKDSCVLLSGRASFELIQKAHMAGISIVLSVGAPSSLAIEMAEDNGMTLIGFVKPDRFNIYVDNGRVK